MATSEEEKKLQAEKKETGKIQQENNSYADKARELAALLTVENRTLGQELKEHLGIKQRTNDFDKALLKVARSITAASEQNAVALGRSGDISKAILKDEINLENALREAQISKIGLANDQVGLAVRVNKFNRQALKLQEEIEQKISDSVDLEGTARKDAEKDIQALKAKQAIKEGDLQDALARLKPAGQTYALALQATEQAKKNLVVKTEEKSMQDQINASMGSTGALIKSAKGMMDQLGMSSLGNFLNVEKATKELQESVDNIERAADAQGNVVINGQKMTKNQALLNAKQSAYNNLIQGAVKGAFSLESILAFVLKSLLASSDQMARLQRSTGMSYKAANQYQHELKKAAVFSGDNFVTTEKLVKAHSMLSKEIGMSAQMLKTESLVSATFLTEKLGLAANEASRLVTMAELTGQSSEGMLKSMGKQQTSLNKQNKTMFSLKDMMEAVASASMATVLTLGKSSKALLAAGNAAKNLGTDLAGVEKIADSLLDFESSIENEMQAQLLTGKNLNLTKARELALAGDLEGVAKEVGKQEAIKSAFATNNVIAQRAAAKALGLSREELAQMTYKQELLTLGASRFKDEYGEVAYNSLKAQSSQDKFNDLISKATGILGDLVGYFSPIIDAIAWIASNPFAGPILAAVIAAKALNMNFMGGIKSMGSMVTSAGKLKDSLISAFKSPGKALKGLGDKMKGAFKEGKDGLANKTKDKTKDLQSKTKGAKGQGPKGFLKSLGDGLASIGKQFGDVVKGALALGIAGIAIGGSFALALKMVKNVDPKTMLAFATSIGIFGGSLALVGKQANNAIKGALAMGIMGVALIPAAYAFSLLENTNPKAIAMLAGSLLVLGTGAAILGALSGNIITGAAALGILGLALVPAAYAFSLLENTDPASIAMLAGSLLVLGAGAAILGTLAPNIIMGAAALGILGLAMVPAAYAFTLLENTDLVTIAKGLSVIGLAAAALGMLSPFIIVGAAAIAVLGVAMIPAALAFNIMAKADLATIAEGLTSIASIGPKLALAGIGMIALAGGAVVLGLASPSLIFSALALGALGLAAQIASTANLQDIAANLVQLGTAGPGLIAAGVGLFAAAGGITAFALAMTVASAMGGISSLFGGGMMADITQLAAMAEPLATVGTALGAIALGVLGLSTALSSLDISKISALNGLMLTTAIAAPMVAAAGAITGVVESITGTGEESKSDGDSKLVAKIDELISAVKQGGDVYLDGGKVGTSLLLSTYKSA